MGQIEVYCALIHTLLEQGDWHCSLKYEAVETAQASLGHGRSPTSLKRGVNETLFHTDPLLTNRYS